MNILHNPIRICTKVLYVYKDKVDFKIYDITTLLTKNYNVHFAYYLKKQKQRDNEIWSVNRI